MHCTVGPLPSIEPNGQSCGEVDQPHYIEAHSQLLQWTWSVWHIFYTYMRTCSHSYEHWENITTKACQTMYSWIGIINSFSKSTNIVPLPPPPPPPVYPQQKIYTSLGMAWLIPPTFWVQCILMHSNITTQLPALPSFSRCLHTWIYNSLKGLSI